MDKPPEEKKIVNTKPIKNRMKKASCFMGIFLGIFLLCGGTIAVFWAGGWMKDLTCGIVMEDSFVWDTASCTKDVEPIESNVDENNVINIQLPDEVESTEELVTNIIEQVSPGVVTVAVNQLTLDDELGVIDQNDGIGSGFVVDSEGLIITNKHVVSDADADYSIFVPGREDAIPVLEIYRDNLDDIALLKVDANDLKALKLGNSSELKRGNLVIAIGSPFGDLDGTATVGYVTGLNREVSAGDGFGGQITQYEGVLQTDAAINPGNSGGPLINSRGEVVGVNFATTRGADNVSFAIPIDRVKSRLEVFETEGRFPQPYIGVSYSQRTLVLNQKIVTAAVILGVEEDGPADTAGLKRGDIIVEVNGEKLSENSFMVLIQSTDVGEKLTLKFWREGEEKTVDVVVGDKSN